MQGKLRQREGRGSSSKASDVGRLGGAVESSRGQVRGKKGEENSHARKKNNETTAEGACLSRSLLGLFISERAFIDTKGKIINCNTGAVSRFRIEMRSCYYSLSAARNERGKVIF
jgi:hypothetical protein